ncbi:MAG: protein kinase [Sandaracinus sp.]
MTPRTFGKYLLDREIARGGMARVHLARLRGLGGFEKTLVLKEIDPRLASDPRFVTLFVEEANTLVQMSHPHIVPVYELGVVEGTYFLAMEHVRGTTLEALVTEGPLDPAEVAHVGAQVADALAYAHERFSLVHRDVTPRNVMIDVHGHARLLDFGIAARLDDGHEGAVFGTPGYLAPEQARGERLTGAADLFSLGAVLHRAATGEHAFDTDVEHARALTSPSALPALDRLPDELARILRATLDPDPTKRPASGKLLAAQLRAFLAARRPEGVADALGARADRLAIRADEARDEAGDEGLVTPPTSGRTQSLATSPVLEERLGTPPHAAERATSEAEGTQPIARAPARATESVSSTTRLDRADATAPSANPASETREEARDASPSPARADAISASASDTAPSSSRSWLVAALLALVLGAASIWALSYARFEAPTGEPRPEPIDPSPLEIDPPDASLDAVVEGLDAGLTDDAVSTSDDASVVDDSLEPDDAGDLRDGPSRAPRDTGPRRASDAHVRAPDRAGTGALTVQALPWADVLLDGERLGRTPLRDRPVPAGDHELTLRCPPLGREVSRTIHVPRDGATRWTANLQTSPPTLSQR